MKLEIGKPIYKEENLDPVIDEITLNGIKFDIENDYVNIDEIKFDADTESLKRLKMLSQLNQEIEFKDADNNTLLLTGQDISNYIPLIEQRLGERFISANTLYNTFKNRMTLSGEFFTFNQVLTSFQEILNDEI